MILTKEKLLIFWVVFCGLYLPFSLSAPKCNNCTIITREEFQNLTLESYEWINLVPKCCNITQRLTQLPGQELSICAEIEDDWEFAPLLWKANKTGMRRYNYSSLTVVIGNPCTYGKYPLEPYVNDRDEYYIFDSGKVYLPQDNSNMVDITSFCLDYHRPEKSDKDEITPFMCFDQKLAEKPISRKRFFLYATALLISVPFLLCTFLVYVCIPRLNDTHGKCLACHVLCLGIAFLALASVQLAGEQFPKSLCVTFAFIIQFFFLCCFFWLNVMCFDTWYNVVYHLKNGTTEAKEKRLFGFYSLYAWSIPSIILFITSVMDLIPTIPSTYLKPNFGLTGCWFNSDDAAFKYFYFPVGLLIGINIIFFIWTSKRLAETVQDIHQVVNFNETNEFVRVLDMKSRWRKYKKISRLCFLLFLVMGINWTMEIVSWYIGGSFAIWTLFDVLNALQGVFIFFIFVYQKPVRNIVLLKIRQLWKNESGDEFENINHTGLNFSNLDGTSNNHIYL